MTGGTVPGALPGVSALLDLSGRVAVVTGASGGIGSAVARRMHEAGASVVAHGHHRIDAAAVLVAELGHRAVTASGDLTVTSDCDAVVQRAVDAFGRLDIWIAAAGVQPVEDLVDMSVEEFRAVLDANLTAVFLGTQRAAVAMTSGGAIVNVASIEGLQPALGHSHYSASKAAVIAHTRAAAGELGERGVRVNTVAPGLIDRPGLDVDWPDGVARWTAACPLGRLGRGDDVADACLFLASDAARWITGATLVVDGGVLTRNTW
jgi:NAD(P)-dependent dehydrogenase (short-subunit alcohol dehydrogenase family)